MYIIQTYLYIQNTLKGNAFYSLMNIETKINI